MSQNIFNIRKCGRCNVEPAFTREDKREDKTEIYSIKCLMCGAETMGNNIYELIPVWNKTAARIAEYKESKAIEKSCQSATEIISEVRDAMCNDYCRYMHEGKSSLTPEDEAYCEENGCLPQCDDCPLNRL